MPDTSSAASSGSPVVSNPTDYSFLTSPSPGGSGGSPYITDPSSSFVQQYLGSTVPGMTNGTTVDNTFAPQASGGIGGTSDLINAALSGGSGGGGLTAAMPVITDQSAGQGATNSAPTGQDTTPVKYVQQFDPRTNTVSWVPQKISSAGSIYDVVSNLLSGNFKGAMADPKGMMGALSLFGAMAALHRPKAPPTPAMLMGTLPASPYNNFTPANQASFDNFMSNFSPVVKNIRPATFKNYAEGGQVSEWPDTDEGGRIPWEHGAHNFANGGVLGRLVTGAGGGQDDLVKAHLSPGEYVMDADVVSALGDGSNEAGAKKLDQMRESIRAHNRAAPTNSIPHKSKGPLEYLKK